MMKSNWWMAVHLVLGAALAACGGGGGSVGVGDGPHTLPVPSVSPGSAPSISGNSPSTVQATTLYSFTPVASDPDSPTLTFSIANRPSWASFSTSTGVLSGTPASADVGTFADITISVTDGSSTRALPAFTLNVIPPPAARTAALSWAAPAQNSDGSQLTDLAGYRVYHGTSADALNDITQVSGATSTSYTFNQLTSGTHYFAVAAYTVAGLESALSTIRTKVIP